MQDKFQWILPKYKLKKKYFFENNFNFVGLNKKQKYTNSKFKKFINNYYFFTSSFILITLFKKNTKIKLTSSYFSRKNIKK